MNDATKEAGTSTIATVMLSGGMGMITTAADQDGKLIGLGVMVLGVIVYYIKYK